MQDLLRGFLVHETSSFVSVVPREIEDIPYATFLVFQSCGRGRGKGVRLAKYFMYDGQCENGESVFTLNEGEFALFIFIVIS